MGLVSAKARALVHTLTAPPRSPCPGPAHLVGRAIPQPYPRRRTWLVGSCRSNSSTASLEPAREARARGWALLGVRARGMSMRGVRLGLRRELGLVGPGCWVLGLWSGFACREDPASEGFVPRSLEQAELRLDLRRTDQGRGTKGGGTTGGVQRSVPTGSEGAVSSSIPRGRPRGGRGGEEAVAGRPRVPVSSWACRAQSGRARSEEASEARGPSSGPAQRRPLCACVWTLSVSPVTSVAWYGCG